MLRLSALKGGGQPNSTLELECILNAITLQWVRFVFFYILDIQLERAKSYKIDSDETWN